MVGTEKPSGSSGFSAFSILHFSDVWKERPTTCLPGNMLRDPCHFVCLPRIEQELKKLEIEMSKWACLVRLPLASKMLSHQRYFPLPWALDIAITGLSAYTSYRFCICISFLSSLPSTMLFIHKSLTAVYTTQTALKETDTPCTGLLDVNSI